MSDPRPEPAGPPPGTPSAAPPIADPVTAPDLDRADNAPTIISKAFPARNGIDSNFASLLRGRRLAHYELEEAIGVGGMAAVIRARDTQLDRRVALKILPPEMATDPENIRRFQQEARAAAKLDHENIARVFYCGEDQGLHFIAFEFVEGQNLRLMLERRGRLPVAEALHYVLQIATGLVHAGIRGVVHRDIKPSNIIVGENGRAKLVDMGLARSLEPRNDKGLTHSGVTLGTFDYISPEQALEPRDADARSDIYSLGCTFYHMLTGHAPVPEGTAARKLQFHQLGSPIDPRQLNPAIPDEVAAILSRMMAKDPKDRYQKPEFLVQHLLAVAHQLSSQKDIPHGNEVLFVESILPSPPRMRPFAVATLAGLAVVGLILVLGVLLHFLNADQAQNSPRQAANGSGPKGSQRPREPIPFKNPAESVEPYQVGSVQQLRDVLQENSSAEITLEPDKVYELGDADARSAPPGLVFTGSDARIEAAKAEPGKPGARPVIRLTYDPSNPWTKTWAAIKLLDGTLTFRGIRFEIDSVDGTVPMTAFWVEGGRLILDQCEFVQKGPTDAATGGARMTVLKVVRNSTGSSSAGVKVECRGCYYAGGQEAIALEEGAQIDIQQCAFAPYQRPIQVNGSSAHWSKTAIAVGESSFLLDAVRDADTANPPTVFLIDGQQLCSIRMHHCIVSQPEAEEAGGSRWTYLLLGRRQDLERCSFSGESNYYHSLGSLVATTTQEGGVRPWIEKAPFSKSLGHDLQDIRSRGPSSENPWAVPNPIKLLPSAGPGAFRVNVTLPFMKPPLGPALVTGRKLYPDLDSTLPPSIETPAVARELYVDRQGPYKSLAGALSAAETDEVVIIIKVNGVLSERPLDISKKKVTIRAADGYHPVIALDSKYVPGAEGEAWLFRVHDQELILERLEFQLQPLAAESTKLESIVAITGSGRCRFDRCWATLDGSFDGPALALLSLADPTGAMMGTGTKPARAGGPPLIELVDCFVRGQGDMVTVGASRPYRLDVKHSLLALAGSLVNVKGNKPGMSVATEATLSLDRVTAYLTQNLVTLQASATNPVQVPLRVDAATACLFVTAEGGKPLLSVDGPESEKELRQLVSWRGQRNCYSMSGSLLMWQPFDKALMPHRYDKDRWIGLWGPDDDQPRFLNVTFKGFLSPDQLARAVPDEFRIQSTDTPDMTDLVNIGADLSRLLAPAPELPSEQE